MFDTSHVSILWHNCTMGGNILQIREWAANIFHTFNEGPLSPIIVDNLRPLQC